MPLTVQELVGRGFARQQAERWTARMKAVEDALTLSEFFGEEGPEEERERAYYEFFRGVAAMLRNIDKAYQRVKERSLGPGAIPYPGCLEDADGDLFQALQGARQRLILILDLVGTK